MVRSLSLYTERELLNMGFSSCHPYPKSSEEIDSFFRKLARRVRTLNPCQQENVMNRFEEVVESTERGTHCNRIFSSSIFRNKYHFKDEKARSVKRRRSVRRRSCCPKKSVCSCNAEYKHGKDPKREKDHKHEKESKRDKSCRPHSSSCRRKRDETHRDRSSRHRSCSLVSCHCSCRCQQKSLHRSTTKTRGEHPVVCRCSVKKEDKKKL